MAHSLDSDEYSSNSQFFFYLYDKRNVSKLATLDLNIPSELLLSFEVCLQILLLLLLLIFFLNDVQAGLGGLSFDEGQFSVFGYTTSTLEQIYLIYY